MIDKSIISGDKKKHLYQILTQQIFHSDMIGPVHFLALFGACLKRGLKLIILIDLVPNCNGNRLNSKFCVIPFSQSTHYNIAFNLEIFH